MEKCLFSCAAQQMLPTPLANRGLFSVWFFFFFLLFLLAERKQSRPVFSRATTRVDWPPSSRDASAVGPVSERQRGAQRAFPSSINMYLQLFCISISSRNRRTCRDIKE